MLEVIVRSVATETAGSDVRRCREAEAVLRQMSWALSYPSANITDQFRELLADQSVRENCIKKCA